ncbi:unnamed protein product [Rotaria magnacalcarata]|uniref:Uncharacterized protein n=1 Tax=Rotaria magnacalcarata TaxID=392030 RepID=A0A816X4F6_9BILA|nr:unnamed protein product [Rotaria magnacalcarata]CAF1579692.1 unnamed protein product [Rotaria magnacalcarata]CAF2141817.1 unnamed protein product [Rotaria magnacalcarata]CAF4092325.1 unnamed protein product [Rotaria magnacalcarata]CAF4515603.1 unnamed protein product [Rotaria magnacalcarata]
MKTYNNLHQLEPSPMIQNIFIVGGWNNNNYITLKSKINIICDQCNTRIKENSSLPSDEFNLFLNNEDDDDDNPNNYIVDSTLVYDRSSIPHTFIIWQYAGQEKYMNDPRSNSVIQAIYEFDPTSKHLRACICSNAYKSAHYDDFFKLVLLNVGNPQFIYPSFNSDYLKKNLMIYCQELK